MNKAFDEIRKNVIFEYNKKEIAKEKPSYMRERNKVDDGNNDIVFCSTCKGCFSKSYKRRHKIRCGQVSARVMVPLVSIAVNEFKDHFKGVLNSMIIDDISSLAKNDPIILLVGLRIYNSQK